MHITHIIIQMIFRVSHRIMVTKTIMETGLQIIQANKTDLLLLYKLLINYFT